MKIKGKSTAFLLMLAACVSTALMLHYQNTRYQKIKTAKPKDPNLIVLNTTFSNFTENGELHIKLSSPKAVHYPEKDSTVILSPTLQIYSKNKKEWLITAKNALAQKGNKIVNLWGNVKVTQPKEENSPQTAVTTSELTLYPKRSFGETNQPVVITRGHSTLRAKGMTVDFKKGILTTKSKTRGTYDPKNK